MCRGNEVEAEPWYARQPRWDPEYEQHKNVMSRSLLRQKF